MAHTVQEPQFLKTGAKDNFRTTPSTDLVLEGAFRFLCMVFGGYFIGGVGILLLLAESPLDTLDAAVGAAVFSPFGVGVAAIISIHLSVFLASFLAAILRSIIKKDLPYAIRVFTGEEFPEFHPALKVFDRFAMLMLPGLFVYVITSAISSAM